MTVLRLCNLTFIPFKTKTLCQNTYNYVYMCFPCLTTFMLCVSPVIMFIYLFKGLISISIILLRVFLTLFVMPYFHVCL